DPGRALAIVVHLVSQLPPPGVLFREGIDCLPRVELHPDALWICGGASRAVLVWVCDPDVVVLVVRELLPPHGALVGDRPPVHVTAAAAAGLVDPDGIARAPSPVGGVVAS